MKTLEQYILRLLLWPTVVISLSLTSIIWLTQALRFIDFIINRGLSISDFMLLTVLLIPSLLFLILPIALFISVMFIYNKLLSDSELVVMNASGISHWQIVRPVMIFGMGLAILCYIISLYVMPMTKREFKDAQNYLRDNYTSILLQEEVFNNPVDGLTVFIRSRDSAGNLKGILVHDARATEHVVTMMADQARLVETPTGPQFHLINGMRQEKRDGRLSWLNFDNYNLDINYYTKSGGPRSFGPDEMSLGDLVSKAKEEPEKSLRYWAEFHQRLLWPLYAMGLPLFGVAVLLRGQFNRRGQWKRITASGIAVTAIILGAFGVNNLIAKHAIVIPLAYMFAIGLILCSLVYIVAPGFTLRAARPLKVAR